MFMVSREPPPVGFVIAKSLQLAALQRSCFCPHLEQGSSPPIRFLQRCEIHLALSKANLPLLFVSLRLVPSFSSLLFLKTLLLMSSRCEAPSRSMCTPQSLCTPSLVRRAGAGSTYTLQGIKSVAILKFIPVMV